jgi:opacity protein-like surface antigen
MTFTFISHAESIATPRHEIDYKGELIQFATDYEKELYHQQHPKWYIAANYGLSNFVGFTKTTDITYNTFRTDIHTISKPKSSNFYDVRFGYLFTHMKSWPHNLAVGLLYQDNAKQTIESSTSISNQGATPVQKPGVNQWDISSKLLMLTAKIAPYQWHSIVPFVELGIGTSENTSNNYISSPVNDIPAIYQSKTTPEFAYSLGLGAAYSLSPSWRLNIESNYQDLGKTQLGKDLKNDKLQPDGPALKLKSINLTLGIEYRF